MIASERGEVGLAAGVAVLRDGGRALDAVEAAIRVVEANEADHYVGVGGLPNLVGDVELDASIMDGATRRAGAVAAVTGFPHPISIARAVLEQLHQHVLLVGRGAERFADETGIERGETLTDEAVKLWREGLSGEALTPAGDGAGAGETAYRQDMLARLQAMTPPPGLWGTVNVLALDAAGDLCVGVSTSGYPWKYPGRVGDSALIGSGNYCDNRVGGAACTGRGELAIRGNTARSVLLGLAGGLDPAAACAAAVRETLELPDEYRSGLQALCLAPDGRHGGASTRAGATYAVMTASDETYRIEKRSQV
ncbi:MAG TPA: isoaspartyl peptidase/L-asparaginase [Streptosporangiaceae bacterium]|jgi:beta-aspartyl-peptidase (threonine type)